MDPISQIKREMMFKQLHFKKIILLSITFLLSATFASPVHGPAADLLESLVRFEPWAESIWTDCNSIPGSGYFGDGKSDGNGGIRGTCGIALSYAVLLLEFPDAPQRPQRLRRIEATLRYASQTHATGPAKSVAVNRKKWGGSWQSSLWAAMMGFSAALLEKELDPQVVSDCKRVIAFEADRLVSIQPVSRYKGNSSAEENAWNSSIPALAAAWMPQNKRAAKWIETAKKYLANTYTVSDTNGDLLKEWISTQTLYDSYALENHGFYHPTYQMVSGMSMGDTYVMAALTNPDVAKEIKPFAEHNVKQVWQFVKGIMLDSGEVAYPSGLDWTLHSFGHVSYMAYLACHFKEPQAQWAQSQMANQILYRQAINGDGRFTGESCPDGFYREAVQASRIAIAYLQNKIEGYSYVKEMPPQNHLTHYEDVRLIIHRSDKAMVTVNYGIKPMAMIYPLNGKSASKQFFVSPNQKSFIGGHAKCSLEKFSAISDGFRVELKLDGKDGQNSGMIIESKKRAIVFIEIPLSDSTLTNEWFLTAIENHPLTGKHRKLSWQDGACLAKERSGDSHTISSNWIDIDDWMGIIGLPQGVLAYNVAAKYNRRGAAEDSIVFQTQDSQKPRAVIILPGADAKMTAIVAGNICLNVSETGCSLSFTLPGEKQITVQTELISAVSGI
ncbi:MAG: hypothetical protein A2Y10_05080 [Planctomycetes bacterium GWF2_41_51]|nr:MAG: hypothetical protein A2Y10_05080 [Planctomycetes bacterium GWF2_41_51]HBG25562.1 hypothetical protein [Phycisphaerales bacterium]